MNVERILQTMNEHEVDYILIGGLNFYLRHDPVTTFDVDLWIEDSAENRRRCERALAELDAQWGRTDEQWGSVAQKDEGWLDSQAVYSLNCPAGAIDIFRAVRGLSDWRQCASRAVRESLRTDLEYLGLADADMLQCQLALDEGQRRNDRIAALRRAIGDEATDE